MIKAIIKTLGWAILLIAIPLILLIAGLVFTLIGPIAGLLMIIFLPCILVGVIIGYGEGKKK